MNSEWRKSSPYLTYSPRDNSVNYLFYLYVLFPAASNDSSKIYKKKKKKNIYLLRRQDLKNRILWHQTSRV
uniref:Uncharacterized protein n=1 Tax=Octopus bimaculoides TaxID=37653 RepID=A0A0L8GG14_OCTBM